MNRRKAGHGWLATFALLVISTVVAILLSELGLRFALNPGDFLQATLVDDPILGQRIEPLSTGHDALGYRNSDVPEHADIVAIGDSLTYGVNATRESSWPQQLGRLLGERVYNMALGGYGPLQYLQLAQTSASRFKPKVLIVGFYFGNDLMDSFYLSQVRPHWHSWRISDNAASGETAFAAVGEAEPHKRFGTIRDWLSHHSLLYCVLRATVFQRLATDEQDKMARKAGPDNWLLWNDRVDPAVRTIFKPKYRLTGVDLNVGPVREGMQISQHAFAALKVEAQRNKFDLLTVLIPTKERAYCRYLAKSGETLPESFAALCEAEAKANAEFASFLRAQDIAFVDVLPVLEARIDRHVQVYPANSDGHPLAAGYAAIAEAIAPMVQQGLSKR